MEFGGFDRIDFIKGYPEYTCVCVGGKITTFDQSKFIAQQTKPTHQCPKFEQTSNRHAQRNLRVRVF
jgi:hypothetical protein